VPVASGLRPSERARVVMARVVGGQRRHHLTDAVVVGTETKTKTKTKSKSFLCRIRPIEDSTRTETRNLNKNKIIFAEFVRMKKISYFSKVYMYLIAECLAKTY
jgi:hypothetical protein